MTGSATEGEALNPKERGEFERRRGWRIDQGTLERFRELVNEFHGSQYVTPSRYVW
jgi:tRNA pseudouridine38-40 synthase